jgi:predicted dehydrogenase
MKSYRVAIIGLGRMGSTIDEEFGELGAWRSPTAIAAACAASDRLEVVAGADLLPEKRAAFTGKWGVEAVYEDYLEMIEKERPDMVAICTVATTAPRPARQAPSRDFRDDAHADLTVSVSNAGVPMVFCEKAMACSMAKADAVRDACHKNGTLYNSGLLRRFNNQNHMIRKRIEDGDIGEVGGAVWLGRSSLMHGHIHTIDTLSYLLGDPKIKAIRGGLQPRDLEIEDNMLDRDPIASFQIEYESGVQATAVPFVGTSEFEVIGSEGSIRSLNDGQEVLLRKAGARRMAMTSASGSWWDVAPDPTVTPRSSVVYLLEDLVGAHESGGTTLGNVDVTHQTTEACLAVAESHSRGGAWVELPMERRDLYVFHV